jgi:hypothetical protein
MGDARRLGSTYSFDRTHDEVAAGHSKDELRVTSPDDIKKLRGGVS